MNGSLLKAIATIIDSLNRWIGVVAAWSVLAMMLIQFAIIVMRALFGVGSLWMQESLFYFHALLVLCTAAWTLQNNGHVRVDIFYADASPRTKAIIDLGGAMLLLIPFMIAILWFSWPYAARAWAIREGSRESGGIPLIFVLKTMIPLFAGLMILQGLAQALRAALRLAGPAESPVS